MNLRDIRQMILYEIDDIDDIENLCYTDKLFNQLCLEKSFWLHWYDKNNIKYPNHVYNNVNGYINEYKKIVKIHQQTKEIMDNLLYNSNSTYMFTFRPNNIEFLYLDNHIDNEELIAFLKYSKLVTGKIKRIKNMYEIEYYYHATIQNHYLKFTVNKNTLYQFIYNVLSNDYEFKKLF